MPPGILCWIYEYLINTNMSERLLFKMSWTRSTNISCVMFVLCCVMFVSLMDTEASCFLGHCWPSWSTALMFYGFCHVANTSVLHVSTISLELSIQSVLLHVTLVIEELLGVEVHILLSCHAFWSHKVVLSGLKIRPVHLADAMFSSLSRLQRSVLSFLSLLKFFPQVKIMRKLTVICSLVLLLHTGARLFFRLWKISDWQNKTN